MTSVTETNENRSRSLKKSFNWVRTGCKNYQKRLLETYWTTETVNYNY